MSERNVLQTTFDERATGGGFMKRSGSWYRRQEDTIAVLQLQKSQYGDQYFVNVALWLLSLADAEHPKEQTCHLRSRLSRLLPDEETKLSALLDLESSMPDDDRSAGLGEILVTRLLPLLDLCSTMGGIRSLPGLGAFLITGQAQRALGPI
jgi:hypothetical protein